MCLVESGADLQLRGLYGQTALHTAVHRGKKAITRYLLASGADANALDSEGRTPLGIASGGFHYPGGDPPEDIVLLLKQHGGYDANKYRGMTAAQAFQQAVVASDLAKLKNLLADKTVAPDTPLLTRGTRVMNGAAVEIQRHIQYGTRALHWFCRKGHTEAVSLLVEAGADVNVKDDDGKTPLYFAAAGGQLDTVAYLLANGADTNFGKYRPLNAAVRDGAERVAVARMLLAAGADVNCTDAAVDTPLLGALSSSENLPELLWVLIAAGADVNAANRLGETAVDLAAHDEVALKTLIRHGARLTIRAAISCGRKEEALRLVAEGVNLEKIIHSDSLCWTLRDWAIQNGRRPSAEGKGSRGVFLARHPSWTAGRSPQTLGRG